MSERKRCETLRVSLGRKSHTTVTRVSFHDVVLRPGRGEVETTDVESEKKYRYCTVYLTDHRHLQYGVLVVRLYGE